MAKQTGHMMTSFACGMCGKCLQSAEECLEHIRGHTADRPFHCLVCWPLFSTITADQPSQEVSQEQASGVQQQEHVQTDQDGAEQKRSGCKNCGQCDDCSRVCDNLEAGRRKKGRPKRLIRTHKNLASTNTGDYHSQGKDGVKSQDSLDSTLREQSKLCDGRTAEEQPQTVKDRAQDDTLTPVDDFDVLSKAGDLEAIAQSLLSLSYEKSQPSHLDKGLEFVGAEFRDVCVASGGGVEVDVSSVSDKDALPKQTDSNQLVIQVKTNSKGPHFTNVIQFLKSVSLCEGTAQSGQTNGDEAATDSLGQACAADGNNTERPAVTSDVDYSKIDRDDNSGNVIDNGIGVHDDMGDTKDAKGHDDANSLVGSVITGSEANTAACGAELDDMSSNGGIHSEAKNTETKSTAQAHMDAHIEHETEKEHMLSCVNLYPCNKTASENSTPACAVTTQSELQAEEPEKVLPQAKQGTKKNGVTIRNIDSKTTVARDSETTQVQDHRQCPSPAILNSLDSTFETSDNFKIPPQQSDTEHASDLSHFVPLHEEITDTASKCEDFAKEHVSQAENGEPLTDKRDLKYTEGSVHVSVTSATPPVQLTARKTKKRHADESLLAMNASLGWLDNMQSSSKRRLRSSASQDLVGNPRKCQTIAGSIRKETEVMRAGHDDGDMFMAVEEVHFSREREETDDSESQREELSCVDQSAMSENAQPGNMPETGMKLKVKLPFMAKTHVGEKHYVKTALASKEKRDKCQWRKRQSLSVSEGYPSENTLPLQRPPANKVLDSDSGVPREDLLRVGENTALNVLSEISCTNDTQIDRSRCDSKTDTPDTDALQKEEYPKLDAPTDNCSFSVDDAGVHFDCKKCGARFRQRLSLMTHMAVHRPAKSANQDYMCDICGRTFSRPYSVKIHRLIHTKEAVVDCSICGKTLANPVNLQIHMRIHTDERPYVCPSCPKRFRQHAALLSHQRTHSKERPYVCEICGKCYAFQKNLYTHRFAHTGQRPYVCKVCNSAFRQLTALNVHMRCHTGEKPFKCPHCSSAFAQKSHLKKHVQHLHEPKVTSPEKIAADRAKPYRCVQCDKGFCSPFSLRRHMNSYCTEDKKHVSHTKSH